MGKNAKLKEKQKWSHEKLHLENARKLREETDKTASDIQARSFMAGTLERNVKER